ncbi:MAG: asparagine synthase (glutamine-hydrolyzing) [Alphaproteobacteria bacterium]
MCGIAGIIEKNALQVDETRLKAMTDQVAHRGPDGEGFALLGTVGFGHRRLAILDLSPEGAQPMSYGDSGLTIIHNGEIYNYLELREALKALGYQFHTQTDTEVILAAYLVWGEDCVTRFNGMWAFAIHDAKRQLVFCSRDRFGVKPFYYYENDERFVFGSEIRQILPFCRAIRAHREALENFIITAANELGDNTFFEGVKRLPASHSLVYDLTTHQHRLTRYYTLTRPAKVSDASREEATDALFALLVDAVKLRLRSDVKVGTCLSGGLDSSSVATIAASLSRKGAFAAITAVSEQESNNEAGYAALVASAAGLDWYQITPSYEDFVASLPEIVRVQEEPFISASIVMQYWVMKTARTSGIPVLLDGQGGDELLLGYERYYATAILRMLKKRGLWTTLRELRQIQHNNSKMHPLNIFKYLLGAASSHIRYGYYCWQHRYLRHSPKRPPHLKALARAVTDVRALQTLDVTSTSLPSLLRFEDKNSMAHGIETRLPFLDYRLVEFALTLPVDYKIHKGWSKWLLRQAMVGNMPDSIVWRKNKIGFEAPENIWLAQHEAIMQEAVMTSPLIGALAKRDKLMKLYPRLDARSRFRLYSVALWGAEFKVTL